ncbi:hypothetical protein [Massilia frigida]|uniref:hypothetical protein n=1 Tax=Massilia frigida TaxID=2609281 RepID=UPI0014223095|nr:hypothetical protein [Massilia frigida]
MSLELGFIHGGAEVQAGEAAPLTLLRMPVSMIGYTLACASQGCPAGCAKAAGAA